MYGYIYKTTCVINNIIYIGQKKSNTFLCEKYLGSGKILKNAINKYGRENFKTELLEECETFELLNEREIYWINYFDSTNPEIGYNITTGGQGTPGVDPGYHLGMLGKHQSDKLRESVRRACSYKRSKEVCENMSKALTGKIIPAKRKKVKCIELDIVFDCIKDANKFINLPSAHISDVCNGKRPNAGGYTWLWV